MTRPSWDEYFMSVARLVATRATCPRRHVGAVIVKDKRILATGYNGSLPGSPHCDDVGCMIVEAGGGCKRTIHAEANALAQAGRHGVALLGSSIYLTTSPCLDCFKNLAANGIKEIVYEESYREEHFLGMARLAGMTVRKHDQYVTSVQPRRKSVPPAASDDNPTWVHPIRQDGRGNASAVLHAPELRPERREATPAHDEEDPCQERDC